MRARAKQVFSARSGRHAGLSGSAVTSGPTPMKGVSLPTHSPPGVACRAVAPTPRGLRPGFHASGTPVSGSSAPRPGRGTAPWPAASRPRPLLSQRWWPPTYTASPVTAVDHSESAPV